MEITMEELQEIMCKQSERKLPESVPMAANPYERLGVGSNVIIRTVTMIYTGKVVAETYQWIVLSDCAWIADTGRWSIALKTGKFNEVEPYPDDCDVRVAIGAVVDIAAWKHDLPRIVK